MGTASCVCLSSNCSPTVLGYFNVHMLISVHLKILRKTGLMPHKQHSLFTDLTRSHQYPSRLRRERMRKTPCTIVQHRNTFFIH